MIRVLFQMVDGKYIGKNFKCKNIREVQSELNELKSFIMIDDIEDDNFLINLNNVIEVSEDKQ